MAASNLHRKLLEHSTNGTAVFQICLTQCDPQLNPAGVCSAGCYFICPSFCFSTESSPPPSSSLSPTTSPYDLSTPPEHHHSPVSLPLKISFIFLMAAFVYTLYKFYTVRYRHRHGPLPPPRFLENQQTHEQQHDVLDHPIWYVRTIGLQPSVINAITIVKFSKTDGVVEGTTCSVCLIEFEEKEKLRLLPNCKHAFHISCIDTWLRSHRNCPLCRAGISHNTVDTPYPE